MSQVNFCMGKLFGRHFLKSIRSRTVINHLGLTPDAGVLRGDNAARSNRHSLGSLLASAHDLRLSYILGADAREIASRNLVASLSIASLTDRPLQQFAELFFQV